MLRKEEAKGLCGVAGSPAARSFRVSLPVGLPEVVFAAAWSWVGWGELGAVGSWASSPALALPGRGPGWRKQMQTAKTRPKSDPSWAAGSCLLRARNS